MKNQVQILEIGPLTSLLKNLISDEK